MGVAWTMTGKTLNEKRKEAIAAYICLIALATKPVTRIFMSLSAVYGVALSLLFAWGLWFQDMPALEKAVKANAQHAEMRHRINVFADGVWFLLANIIVLNSVAALSQAGKKND